MSNHKDLDAVSIPRRVELVESLVAAHPPKKLWKEHGILADIVVCLPIARATPTNNNTHMLPKPFTNDFPRADIYRIMMPDLLHQVIKGTFKDHLVTWVCHYLEINRGSKRAEILLDEMDRR